MNVDRASNYNECYDPETTRKDARVVSLAKAATIIRCNTIARLLFVCLYISLLAPKPNLCRRPLQSRNSMAASLRLGLF